MRHPRQVRDRRKEGSLNWNQLGGQQQLVAVARVVISNPKVILADEPTGNLHNNSETGGALQKLNEGGTTIIQVTHRRRMRRTAAGSFSCATAGSSTSSSSQWTAPSALSTYMSNGPVPRRNRPVVVYHRGSLRRSAEVVAVTAAAAVTAA